MKILNLVICVFIMSIEVTLSYNNDFALLSNDINSNEINEKFTPYGDDVNPSFMWVNPPDNVKSFAFAVEDPDAPHGLFYHWIVINIPKNKREIKRNSHPGKLIKNSWGQLEYKGPKPPSGIHRYHFVLYALDVKVIKVRSYEDFKKEIDKHVIMKREIVAPFKSRK